MWNILWLGILQWIYSADFHLFFECTTDMSEFVEGENYETCKSNSRGDKHLELTLWLVWISTYLVSDDKNNINDDTEMLNLYYSNSSILIHDAEQPWTR